MRRGCGMSTVHSRAIRPGREDSRTTRWASRTASRTLCVTNRTDSARLRPDPGQLVVQHVPGDGVERGERLVHQQQLAVLGERAGQRHALPHAAGQLVHPLAVRALQPHQRRAARSASRAALRLAAPRAAAGPVRCSCPRSATGTGRAPGTSGPAGRPVRRWCPAVGLVQPRDQVEQRGLAAARGPQEADELAGRDIEGDVVQDELLPAGSWRRTSRRARCVRRASTARAVSAALARVVAMVVTSWELDRDLCGMRLLAPRPASSTVGLALGLEDLVQRASGRRCP